MTLVTLKRPLVWPGICLDRFNGTPILGADTTVSAAGHYLAYVFCARETMAITHVGFKPGSATGSPTVDVRIETVDSSLLPSGTLFGTDTNIVTGAVSANTYLLSALTATANISKGQLFAVKIAYNSGTSLQLQRVNNMQVATYSFPFVVQNSGSPARALMNGIGTISLGSSSTAFYNIEGGCAISSIGGGTFNNTNGARRGVRFTAPFNARLIGARVFTSSSLGDFNLVAYDDAGSELSSSSTAFDGDVNGVSWAEIYLDNAVSVSAGTTYRVASEPSSATNSAFYTVTLPSADYRNTLPWSTDGHYTTYASGSWTDSATDQVPIIDLIFDQIDDGAGSGGGSGQRVISG